MEKEHKREKSNHIIWKYIMLIIGATFAAIAIELCLVLNAIIDGGIIAVSLLLNNLTCINFGILVFVINIPFVFFHSLYIVYDFFIYFLFINILFIYFRYKYIGKSFFISSLFSIILLAVIEPSLKNITAVTAEPLLATVFGGLLLGAGVGIVIRNGGALDGTEIMSIVLSKK